MQLIWLRYRDTSADPVQSRRFRSLGVKDLDEVEVIRGRTLHRRIWSFRLSKRIIYEVKIGAREMFLSPAAETFMRNFWTASERWISFDTTAAPPEGSYIAVSVEGGLSPVEFLEDHVRLRSWTLTLEEINPRG
jgi:hypothetical protein